MPFRTTEDAHAVHVAREERQVEAENILEPKQNRMTHANNVRLGRDAAADVGNNEGELLEDPMDIGQNVGNCDDEVSFHDRFLGFFSLLYLVRKTGQGV